MALQGKLDFIYGLRRDYTRDRAFRPPYLAMLAAMGNPHHNLPPVIHVAGTNGKGSVIAFMRAILEKAGWRVHAYTSPHLYRPHERIVLAGREIDDSMLEFLIDQVLQRCPDPASPDLSFFEFFTAAAFTAFAHSPADILLLETGMGGRLDSTNVIENPVASIITTLSYDHTDILGREITAIAAEKAGIIKASCPCIVGPQIHPAVMDVLRSRAGALGSPFYGENEGWRRIGSSETGHDPFGVETNIRSLRDLPAPCLAGAHQAGNAATAIAALLIQDRFKIPERAFAQGLQSAIWPARLQRIDSPLIPPGWELWLDGGHNDSAAMVLAEQARQWRDADGRKLHIVTGMMAHKNAEAFARPLAPFAAGVTCVPLDKGHSPEVLARIWRDSGASVSREGAAGSSWPALLRDILKTGDQGRILVTGSLYLGQWISAG
jgi:dihydrofolate synthase/folylpolyglutamate synthase